MLTAEPLRDKMKYLLQTRACECSARDGVAAIALGAAALKANRGGKGTIAHGTEKGIFRAAAHPISGVLSRQLSFASSCPVNVFFVFTIHHAPEKLLDFPGAKSQQERTLP